MEKRQKNTDYMENKQQNFKSANVLHQMSLFRDSFCFDVGCFMLRKCATIV